MINYNIVPHAACPRMDARPQLDFDEAWYVDRYPDVARAVANGSFRSGFSHYLTSGRQELRHPNLNSESYDRVFAYGAFGSNNVGDEAILEGLRRRYPSCIQIFINKVRNGAGIQPGKILSQHVFFNRGDHLIIGGGGLLYDKPTVTQMGDLAEKARREGATVEILGLGCEAAQEEYYPEICRLFNLIESATLRSTESERIIKDITGCSYSVRPDLAFNLQWEAERLKKTTNVTVTVGIVTASSSMQQIADVSALASLIRKFTIGAERRIRFKHIPHSKSYFNIENNDCISGEFLWTLAKVHDAQISDPFENLPFSADPLTTLNAYSKCDAIISSRYHGLVFGRMMNLPTLAVGKSLIKLRSFLNDRADDSDLVSAWTGNDVLSGFSNLLAIVDARARSAEAE